MVPAIKNLFRDSVVYGVANVIQKLTPVIVIPIITRCLGTDAFEVYDIAFLYTYLFCTLIILSLDSAASVYYFDKKKENFDKRQVLSYAFYIQVISVGLHFLLFFPIINIVGNFIFSNDIVIRSYWRIALLIIPGYMMFNYGLNVLLWQHRKKEYVFLCFLNTFLCIAGVIIFIQAFKGTIGDLFYVLIGGMTFCGLLAIYLIRKDIFIKRVKAPVNYALIIKLLWFGLPFAVTAFFRLLIPSVDRFFLIYFHFNDELHLYILAVKLASFYGIATSAFILAFTPYSLTKLNHDNAEKEISELFHLISIIAFVSVPVLLLCKDWLVLFFAGPGYLVSAQLLPFLFMGWVFDLFSYFTMLGVYKSQNSAHMLVILIFGTLIISLLNILLVPQFGIFGAALSFCITKAVMFFIMLVYLKKHFRIKIRLASFLLIFGVVSVYCYLIFILNRYVYLLMLIPLIVGTVYYLKNNFKGLFFSRTRLKIE